MAELSLIAVTRPDFVPGEAAAIVRLLCERGFSRVHIRKPGADALHVAALVRAVPPQLRGRLSLHDCFEVAADAGAGGVHLNSRCPAPPTGWHGLVSRSCHSLDELGHRRHFDYVFLSPVFDSISKPGYRAAFTEEELTASPLVDSHVVALGGVTPARLGAVARMGFGGAAMLSAAWSDL